MLSYLQDIRGEVTRIHAMKYAYIFHRLDEEIEKWKPSGNQESDNKMLEPLYMMTC
jgi:hypothetical protein